MFSTRIVRAAVVQTCTAAYSLPDTLDKLEYYAKDASQKGAQLAVFPEALYVIDCPDYLGLGFISSFYISIGGYPKMSTFGAVVGARSAEGREEFLRYHSSAIEIPSPAITTIEFISKDLNIFLVVGIIEKDGGTLYCTAIFIDPVEGFVAKHRKLMPTAMERIIWGMGDGSTLPVLEKTFQSGDQKQKVTTKISATICWENYMPLCKASTCNLRTQIYCVPTVDARPVWQHTMRHIALEGRCFVLSACQFSKEKDYPSDHSVVDPNNRNSENVMIAGGSVIVNPLGEVLAGPLLDREGVLVADLDLNDVVRGQFDLDIVGHYARSDIFQLHTNVAAPPV
ncbi:hypothetical protein EW145_g1990 [Phellinidium pouzarii]|uniref:CN hydrolase domain-containing protein n=1 Tax=Phellinidium pouzarii TaxID=167371 RepID=A0A4S4LCS2_9AGAM|nr:hypothetical protein EW145_g1990 [Phellinidium pouzarii]